MIYKNKDREYVLVAGFPRCASTYFYHLLKQHPEVGVPSRKETNFFNHKHRFFLRPDAPNYLADISFKEYESLYSDGKKVYIDFSVATCYDHNSIKKIKKLVGDIKIIFLNRDKEEFVESIYNRMVDNGDIKEIGFEFFKIKYRDFIDYYSTYENHIKEFQDNFTNVLTVNLINNDVKGQMKKVLDFLNLNDYEFNYDVDKNESGREDLRSKSFKTLKRRLFIYTPKLHNVLKKVVG